MSDGPFTVSPAERLKYAVSRAGLNRGTVVRRMVRLGHPRLRELFAPAGPRPPLGRALRPLEAWLERGSIVVPQGHAGGLRMDLGHLPLAHAHLGSIAFGNLEASVQEAMLRHIPKGGVFYDVGANLGFFSLLGAHFAGRGEGHAYAFEPAPDNVAAIRRNLALNVLEGDVTVIEAAVGARSGRARLQVVDDQSWSKLADYGEHVFTTAVLDVRLVALDDVVAGGQARPPDVVKIDVEGAELAVLEGMRGVLAEHRPVLICELHGTHREWVAACRELGYRCVNLEGPVPVEQAGASAHCLALPPGHPGD